MISKKLEILNFMELKFPTFSCVLFNAFPKKINFMKEIVNVSY